MKHTGKCPKCGCETIVELPAVYDAIHTQGLLTPQTVHVAIDLFMCPGCGYSEAFSRGLNVNAARKNTDFRVHDRAAPSKPYR